MSRRILAVTGPDRVAFLQGLVTSDVRRDGLTYAALLTPQGKYLADFFLLPQADAIWVDVAASHADDLARRLGLYRLRAKVGIEPTDRAVARGTGPAPEGAVADPRHPALGWRHYRAAADGLADGPADGPADDGTDWDAVRVAEVIPETGIELTPETYILEAGFERLHGVDFRKGCYVGQEVTARMKHKTDLRKGLLRVAVDGAAAVGTPIIGADGREAGTLYTQSGGHGIAHLRFDRVDGPLTAGAARISPGSPPGS